MWWEDADGRVKVTDDPLFLSHARLEPKVERDQDGLHLIVPLQPQNFFEKFPRKKRPDGSTVPLCTVLLYVVQGTSHLVKVGREGTTSCCDSAWRHIYGSANVCFWSNHNRVHYDAGQRPGAYDKGRRFHDKTTTGASHGVSSPAAHGHAE